MANSVDPDQTAPIGAVCSGSTLFATILNSFFLFLSLYTARPSLEYYRQVFFVHSGLQDESLQVNISKLPQGSLI